MAPDPERRLLRKATREEPITTKHRKPTAKGESAIEPLARFSSSTTSELGTSPRLLMFLA